MERPNDLRPQIVDSYLKSVLELGGQKVLQDHQDKSGNKSQSWVRVIEQVYRLNLDNRILNNLR